MDTSLRQNAFSEPSATDSNPTTFAVQQYLDALSHLDGDSPAEPVIRALLSRAVNRLHLLCGGLLHHSYPRLTQGPVNLRSEEMLSAVVERLIKALKNVRPGTVRQFFALASQHMRWELNDVARRLDEEMAHVELHDSLVEAPVLVGSIQEGTPMARRILAAIEALPDDEREIFNLVRVQGMTQLEAAGVAGCSERTVQRRLSRGLMLLTEQLIDLRPSTAVSGTFTDLPA
jgi:RNA polymerase sigma-70 factor (ECF subfamily)